ncbi:hypothetical protein BDW42DRAFT_192456 [Aspergillus taichungensis]|uniref:Uncharacterized protein n=1 Tax=Aspergillus taichungensis TaxID=482145 RepID=A0A2J5I0D3_9EURO|nr:hypothetical protein BDW42DRAFT_192456 [Aspergillus taichungensis]
MEEEEVVVIVGHLRLAVHLEMWSGLEMAATTMYQEILQREGTSSPSSLLDQILLNLFPVRMEGEGSCRCSLDTLQTMTEIRSVHRVVEMGTILDLAQRIYNQGDVMLKCKICRKNPQTAFVTLPALAEQCLSLFEAVCLAYGITRKEALFDPDPNSLTFDQPLPQFICLRSKVQLGQMELDEGEAGMLIRTLLGRNSVKLLELLQALQDILRSLSKDSGQPQWAGAASLRACEASVESTIHRFAIFMEQIDVETSKSIGHPAVEKG